MSQDPYWADHEDHEDLSALDFSDGYSGHDDYSPSDFCESESAGLDFLVTADESEIDDGDADRELDALQDFSPAENDERPTELDVFQAPDPSDEAESDSSEGTGQFTVINPSETVSVSALTDGRIERVALLPNATRMRESELAEEILAVADLARLKGLAGQYQYLAENELLSEIMQSLGADTKTILGEVMEDGVVMATPQQSAEAQARHFATRYSTD